VKRNVLNAKYYNRIKYARELHNFKRIISINQQRVSIERNIDDS